MRRFPVRLVNVAVALCALAGAFALPPLLAQGLPAAHTVTMALIAFKPAEIEAKIGDVVRFVNDDLVPHNATSRDKTINTGLMKNGAEADIALTKSGVFDYICTFHPNMKGRVTVTAR